jgi:ABC-type multidrug transport system ATPase subunit
MRAGSEVRRLSGGNQQKVTIARWVAGGVKTMLCFDPTRGIDIRTKQQIYVLLRDLAEAGAAILLYTSELKEVELVCDRAIVIFGGRVVAEITAAEASEPTLLRAAYNLRSGAALPEAVAAESVAALAEAEASPAPSESPTHPVGEPRTPTPGRSTATGEASRMPWSRGAAETRGPSGCWASSPFCWGSPGSYSQRMA